MAIKSIWRSALLILLSSTTLVTNIEADTNQHQFTVISKPEYQRVSRNAQRETQALIKKLIQHKTTPNVNQLITTATKSFLNTPYKGTHADGEGDWCPDNYRSHHCAHIQQEPIYRTDQFVCSTYVAQVLALIKATDINEYEKNLLSIKYGAANEPASSITYYNRNNFISADFNRVNENNGLLTNAMNFKNLKPLARSIFVKINHNKWFQFQQRKESIRDNIRVFNTAIGQKMFKRFNGKYPNQFHHFKIDKIDFSYIPKKALFIHSKLHPRQLQENTTVLNLLPTPSVVEIVRDDKRWFIHHHSIAKTIGSGIAVSHMGLLYRAYYKQHQFIYPKIECYNQSKSEYCRVSNVYCQKKQGCDELMFTNATNAYPNNYFFYQKNNRDYACTQYKPQHFKGKIKYCNRVVTMPLSDYFLQKKEGKYQYMDSPSILGIHLEKINAVSLWKKFK